MILEVFTCGGEDSNERSFPAYFYFPLFHASTTYTINPLTPNGLHSGRAVCPLNSRTATIMAANSVSKFGGILFTPIQLFAVVCYAAVLLKVRLPYRIQIVPPPPPTPLHKHRSLCKYAFLPDDIIHF